MTKKNSDLTDWIGPTEAQARNYLLAWLLEFGSGEVSVECMLTNKWYLAEAKWNPARLQPYMAKDDGWSITPQGYDLIRGDADEES